MHALSLAAMAYAGLLTPRVTATFVWAVPAIVIGTSAGIALYRRLDESLFRRLVLVVLTAAGATLIV